MAATSATAMDLPVAGLSLNTDVVLEHKVDASTTQLDLAPELEYTPGAVAGLALTAGMNIDLWDNTNGTTLDDEFDVMPTIDFGATYQAMDNLELELGTAYNFETKERTEITLTSTFAF
jgi:hypothetical protein